MKNLHSRYLNQGQQHSTKQVNQQHQITNQTLLIHTSIRNQGSGIYNIDHHIDMSEQILPTRWEIELEFVQSLANLQYVNYLAQNRYLDDPTFLNYLRYLTYWKKPEYARHLVYPNCLHILDLLLESKSFRERIMRADAMGVIMNEMVGRWKQPQDIFAVTPLAEDKKEKASKNSDEEEIKKEPLNSVDGTPMNATAASTNPTPTGTVI